MDRAQQIAQLLDRLEQLDDRALQTLARLLDPDVLRLLDAVVDPRVLPLLGDLTGPAALAPPPSPLALPDQMGLSADVPYQRVPGRRPRATGTGRQTEFDDPPAQVVAGHVTRPGTRVVPVHIDLADLRAGRGPVTLVGGDSYPGQWELERHAVADDGGFDHAAGLVYTTVAFDATDREVAESIFVALGRDEDGRHLVGRLYRAL